MRRLMRVELTPQYHRRQRREQRGADVEWWDGTMSTRGNA
jgi:hypothetical protein